MYNKKVLIYGPRKGGTTFFQRLLDGGALFVHPSETRIGNFLEILGDDTSEAAKEQEVDRLHSMYPADAWDLPKYEAMLRERIGDCQNLDDYIRVDIDAVQASTTMAAVGTCANNDGWVVKTVGGQTSKVVNSFLRTYGQSGGAVLMIQRDPRFVARAIISDRKKKGVELSSVQKIRQLRSAWRVLIEQQKFRRNRNVLFVRYSHLVDDVEEQIRRVCDFIGISFEKIYCFPTLFGEPTVVRTASQATTGIIKRRKKLIDGLSKWDYILIQLGSVVVISEILLKWVSFRFEMIIENQNRSKNERLQK